MHEVLVNRLGGLSLPRKSVVRLTDRPNTTLDVCRGRKTTMQQQQQQQYRIKSKYWYRPVRANGADHDPTERKSYQRLRCMLSYLYRFDALCYFICIFVTLYAILSVSL